MSQWDRPVLETPGNNFQMHDNQQIPSSVADFTDSGGTNSPMDRYPINRTDTPSTQMVSDYLRIIQSPTDENSSTSSVQLGGIGNDRVSAAIFTKF